MNISYNWLKDLISFDLTADEVARHLTSVGLAVEGIHAHGDDLVLDVDLTSNRPDCLSHLGVARELGAAIGSPLGRVSLNIGDIPYPSALSPEIVTIEAPELCSRFTARVIRGVRIGPSPDWLVARLEAIGERSINNVADITNYVMHELGQPMHAFDLDKVAGNRIVVRRAGEGESLRTLDEIDRKLDETMLAICDAEKPIAIGGLMGGLASSITDETVNVLLEVAYFSPANIRATSRKLGLATEASYRFERGVDVENVIPASQRATALICEWAGGTAGDLVDVYPAKLAASEISSPDLSAAVARLTGLPVDAAKGTQILAALGVTTKENGADSGSARTFVAPSWRHDLSIEEDLVEEVARHTGYDKIAAELPPAYGAGEYQRTELREKLLRRTLVDAGFNEAISYSFIDTRFDEMFEPVPGLIDEHLEDPFVTLQDAVIEGAVRMRPTILPGLLDAARHNFNFGRRDLKLFELGKVFAAGLDDTELPNEQQALVLLVTGGEVFQDRVLKVRELDLYDCKGALEAALEAVGVQADFVVSDVKHLRRGQSAAVRSAGEIIGYIGRLSDDIAASYKFRQPVFVAEIDLQTVLAVDPDAVRYQPLPKYPSIVRDVSFVGPREVSFNAIREAITDQNAGLCQSVLFVDVYEGKGMAMDERSVTVRLEYRSDERTLTEDEVESVHTQLVSGVEERLGIKTRS